MTTKKTIADTASKKSAARRVKDLETLVEAQAYQIERLRGRRFVIPAGRPKAKGKSYCRVVLPDTHGAHIDKIAAGSFLRDLDMLRPAEVVMLGDHIDCGGFLAQHHTMGFVPETHYSYEEDVAAANCLLDEIGKRTGKLSEFWYIMGNHEARIEKWIIKQTLAHSRDAAYLYKCFGTENVLGLAKRGISLCARDQTYHGLRKRGTIKLGRCHFMHGTRCGVNAAQAVLGDMGANTCFGHTHRVSSCVKETANGLVGAWSFGCLCELHPLYGDTNVSNWAHGYGIQVVGKDGAFVTIPVPIHDGRSLLGDLLQSGIVRT